MIFGSKNILKALGGRGFRTSWDKLGAIFWVSVKIGALLRFLRVLDTRRMKVSINKNKETSQRSSKCHDVPESYIANIAMLRSNVMTFQKMEVSTSRHWDSTS